MANYDVKKEWPKIKKELMRVSQEALVLAKKGEDELIRVTKIGKKKVDVTALGLKIEHLHHLIGKEYVKSKCPGTKTLKMNKLIAELKKIHKEKKTLEVSLKKKGRKTAKNKKISSKK